MVKTKPKKCITCGSIFHRKTPSLKAWAKQKFCSRKCNLRTNNGGDFKKGTIPWNKGKSEYAKKLGFGKWMTGKKQSIETRTKKSEIAKKIISEGKHNWYIDGRTPINKIIRHSLEYRLWREAVFKRDDYTCQWCLARCGNGKKVYLHADHILEFSTHPELRFAIDDNGRTLCKDCHYKRHSK